MRKAMIMSAAVAALTMAVSGGAIAQVGGAITEGVAPLPPPTTANARNAGAFPVGAWKPARAGCHDSSEPLRLRKDHSYAGPRDAGSWKLAANRIVFSFRVVGPGATNDMERHAPIRSRSAAIVRLAADRMTLDGAAWKRCSPDPDLYF